MTLIQISLRKLMWEKLRPISFCVLALILGSVDPKNAKSDGANMLDLEKAEGLISKLARLREVTVELQ